LLYLWRKQSVRCPSSIVNISSKILTLKEQNALQFGLIHPILPKRVQKDKIKINLEKLFYSLKGNPDVGINDEIKDDVKYIFRKLTTDSSCVCSMRTNQALHKSLVILANYPSIKVCKVDKGNGVSILNINDYNAKLDAIVGDSSKFQIINCSDSNKHPILVKEDSTAYYVRKYLKKHYDSKLVANLIPSGSSPGKLYGTVKVHKPNCPLRPVVSMVNTPEYDLAKFLDNMIKPYLQ